MKNIKVLSGIIVLYLVSAGLLSCIENLKDIKDAGIDISPEFGIPIAKGDLKLAEGFTYEEDTFIYIYSDDQGLLHLSVRQNFDTLTMDLLLEDYTDKEVMNDTIELLSVPKGVSIESPATYFKLHLDSLPFRQQLDSLLLTRGRLNIDFINYQIYDSEFSITLPNLTDTRGNYIAFNNFKPVAGNAGIAIDLADSKLKLNTPGTTKGIFTVILGYKIMGKVSGRKIPPLIFVAKMDSLDIGAAYGKLRDTTLFMDPDSILFTIPDVVQKTDIDLEDPEINLVFLNQFGLPFNFEFIRFGVLNNSIFEGITGVQKSVYISAPGILNNNEYSRTLLTIDPASNIDRLISKLPQGFLVEGAITTNPVDPDAYNFIRKQDKLIIGIDADIPLKFSLAQVEARDTTPLEDLNKLKKYEDKIDLIKFVINTTNTFPLHLHVQGYIADSLYHVTDSIFTKPVIISAATTALSPSESVFRIEKTRDQIKPLLEGKQLIWKAGFNNSGNNTQNAEFNANQNLKIEVILFTRLNL